MVCLQAYSPVVLLSTKECTDALPSRLRLNPLASRLKFRRLSTILICIRIADDLQGTSTSKKLGIPHCETCETMDLDVKTIDWAVQPQRSLPEAIAERITEAIRIGALRPGERIVENTLAKELRVSRGPLREALKSLEANHLIEIRRSRGTYVAEPTRAQLQAMISVRAALEGWAARLVAASSTPEAISELERQHKAIRREAASGETDRWRDLDWKFHETVCRLSGNAFLLNAWRQHSNLIRLFLHSHDAYHRDVQSVLNNHEAFIKALSSKEPDEAERVFRAAILKSGYAGLNAELPVAFSTIVESDRPLGCSSTGNAATWSRSSEQKKKKRR